MVPKIMIEGGHAWVHERPIAAEVARYSAFGLAAVVDNNCDTRPVSSCAVPGQAYSCTDKDT